MLSAIALLTCLAVGQPPAAEQDQFFELKVRPVLAGTCFKCHGGEKTSGGLRTDSRESLLKKLDGDKAAVVPGKPKESLLIEAIRYQNPDMQMPPKGKLPDEVVANLERWVQDGAKWPNAGKPVAKPISAEVKSHWAFQPVRAVAPPADSTGWSRNPIDNFVVAKRLERGLKPVGEADKRTLLRRVYFDLIGLPPSPDELAAFLTDQSPQAFDKVVDRLLASPRYGERWGRYFMDIVHYADTAGDNADYPIPEAHLYRDYIIDSFNADKPYDQFLGEQLAGDILAKTAPPEKYAELVTATGYLALGRRYATAPYEFWPLTIEDIIDTTSKSMLGLTVRCARCHDHKYDPITTADYYSLYGTLDSTQFPWAGGEEFASKNTPRQHFVPLLPPAQAEPRLKASAERIAGIQSQLAGGEKSDRSWKQVAALNQRIDEIKRQIETAKKEKRDLAALNAELADATKQRDQLKAQIDKKLADLPRELRELQMSSVPQGVPCAYAVTEGKPHDVPIQLRGVAETPGPIVPRGGAPAFLNGGKPLTVPSGESGRLQFAQWLTRRDNPLTARVMINRIWQSHFGKGLVTTPSNFGMRGSPPSHPELLDYLAARFVEEGWSIKNLHRLIVSSRTWQLASAPDPADAAVDPANTYYWRFDRNRLDAEGIRDAMLSVSGRLDLQRPGAQPFPPITQWNWSQHTPFMLVFPSNHRSVYLMTARFQRHPYLALFDGPDTNTSVGAALPPRYRCKRCI